MFGRIRICQGTIFRNDLPWHLDFDRTHIASMAAFTMENIRAIVSVSDFSSIGNCTMRRRPNTGGDGAFSRDPDHYECWRGKCDGEGRFDLFGRNDNSRYSAFTSKTLIDTGTDIAAPSVYFVHAHRLRPTLETDLFYSTRSVIR